VTIVLALLASASVAQHAAAIERAREGRHPEAWDAAMAEPDALLAARARAWVAWSAGDLFGARRELRLSRATHGRDPVLLEWQLQLCLDLRDAEGAREALEALEALGGAPSAELARRAVEELARAEQDAGEAVGAARLVAMGALAAALLALSALARHPR
jgi:hypothetical protein